MKFKEVDIINKIIPLKKTWQKMVMMIIIKIEKK